MSRARVLEVPWPGTAEIKGTCERPSVASQKPFKLLAEGRFISHRLSVGPEKESASFFDSW